MWHRQALEAVGAILASLVVVLVSYFIAVNSQPEPRPWPKGAIYYYNSSEFDLSLSSAVTHWNKALAPLGLRFIETERRHHADVVIRSAISSPNLGQGCDKSCTGTVDQIGAPPAKPDQTQPGHPTVLTVLAPTLPDIYLADQMRTTTFIHELGHVLGLVHDDAYCSVMNSFRKCPMLSSTNGKRFMCGPFAADLDQLEALYGTRPRNVGFWCESPSPDVKLDKDAIRRLLRDLLRNHGSVSSGQQGPVSPRHGADQGAVKPNEPGRQAGLG